MSPGSLAAAVAGVSLLVLLSACGGCSEQGPPAGAGSGTTMVTTTSGTGTDGGITPPPTGWTTSSGGSGPCFPMAWPEAVPKDWIEFDDWSCHARFYYPPDPATMVPPIVWDPCPESPGGIDCRAMRIDWTTEPIAIALDPSFDRMPDGKGVLQFRRNLPQRRDYLVAQSDGPVRTTFARVVAPGEDSSDPGVWVGSEEIREGRYAYYVDGDESFGSALSSLHRGAIAGSIDDPAPHVVAHFADGKNRSWFVSATKIGRLGDNGLEVRVSSWSMDDEILVTSPALDPEGMKAGQLFLVGDTLFWDTSTLKHDGVNVWEAATGARPFIRWIGDYTKGAADLGSDGVDLVWSYGEGKEPNDTKYPTRSIMTAPFTADPDKVAATQRRLRSLPYSCIGCQQFVVGCGYAANEGGTNNVLVVRIADGWSWFLPNTDEQELVQPIGVDCQDVLVLAMIAGQVTLARIRLDSLGPGMPPD